MICVFNLDADCARQFPLDKYFGDKCDARSGLDPLKLSLSTLMQCSSCKLGHRWKKQNRNERQAGSTFLPLCEQRLLGFGLAELSGA